MLDERAFAVARLVGGGDVAIALVVILAEFVATRGLVGSVLFAFVVFGEGGGRARSLARYDVAIAILEGFHGDTLLPLKLTSPLDRVQALLASGLPPVLAVREVLPPYAPARPVLGECRPALGVGGGLRGTGFECFAVRIRTRTIAQVADGFADLLGFGGSGVEGECHASW